MSRVCCCKCTRGYRVSEGPMNAQAGNDFQNWEMGEQDTVYKDRVVTTKGKSLCKKM